MDTYTRRELEAAMRVARNDPTESDYNLMHELAIREDHGHIGTAARILAGHHTYLANEFLKATQPGEEDSFSHGWEGAFRRAYRMVRGEDLPDPIPLAKAPEIEEDGEPE